MHSFCFLQDFSCFRFVFFVSRYLSSMLGFPQVSGSQSLVFSSWWRDKAWSVNETCWFGAALEGSRWVFFFLRSPSVSITVFPCELVRLPRGSSLNCPSEGWGLMPVFLAREGHLAGTSILILHCVWSLTMLLLKVFLFYPFQWINF